MHPSLSAYFKDRDYIDIKTVDGHPSLRQFVSTMLSYYPWWVVALYGIRELLVPLLGLVRHPKPDQLPKISAQDLAFTPGERASFFIVRDAKEDIYWVAETPRDRHLMAYFGVVAEELSSGTRRFHVFTSVKYCHWTGPVYFNIIRPFHHLVVRRMMSAGIQES